MTALTQEHKDLLCQFIDTLFELAYIAIPWECETVCSDEESEYYGMTLKEAIAKNYSDDFPKQFEDTLRLISEKMHLITPEDVNMFIDVFNQYDGMKYNMAFDDLAGTLLYSTYE